MGVPRSRHSSCLQKKEKGKKLREVELHPIRLPVGLPVLVSYRPSLVGIRYGIGIKLGLTNAETT